MHSPWLDWVIRHRPRVQLKALDRVSFHVDKGETLALNVSVQAQVLNLMKDLTGAGRTRVPVGGEVPNPLNPSSGYTFHPRCPHANERCRQEAPQMVSYDHSQAACHALEEGRL